MNKHKPKGRIRKKPHPLERPVIRMMYQTDSMKSNFESFQEYEYLKSRNKESLSKMIPMMLFTAIIVAFWLKFFFLK